MLTIYKCAVQECVQYINIVVPEHFSFCNIEILSPVNNFPSFLSQYLATTILLSVCMNLTLSISYKWSRAVFVLS